MPKYSAIIFDLDGTAIPALIDAVPSQTLIDATHQYREELSLCAATGRSWQYARPIIKALGLNKPCIISGGAQIIDPVKEEIIWEATFDSGQANQILDIAQRLPYPAYVSQGLETSPRTNPQELQINKPVNTFYILNIPQEEVGGVITDLANLEGITASKAGSWSKEGVDLHMTSSEATKEHAVAELCRILQVDSAQTAGVGDNFNDLHLFKAVGHKVAVGNAVEELKAAADEVIDSMENEGLAKFIAAAAS